MIYSYSFFSAFENCPREAQDRFVLRTPRPEKESAIPGIEEHAAIAQRLAHGITLPEPYLRAERMVQSLEKAGKALTEVKLGVTRDHEACDFFSGACFLRGVIDVLLLRGSVAFLGDWKTGKVREKELQLLIFALLVFAHHPEVGTIIAANLWLKVNRVGERRVYKIGEVPSMWAEVYARVAEIERAETWPEKPSPLCGWCQVVECKFNPRRER